MMSFFKRNKTAHQERTSYNAPEVDFDTLSQNTEADRSNKNMEKLWSAVYALDEWHFVARSSGHQQTPFIGIVQDKPFFMAFTDTHRARLFAEANRLLDTEGKARIMSLPSSNPDYYLQFLKHGVFGILFNNGEHGFFAPLENIHHMHKHFKKS